MMSFGRLISYETAKMFYSINSFRVLVTDTVLNIEFIKIT